MTVDISRIGSTLTALGECPRWDDAHQRLWYMDCRNGIIYHIEPDSGASQSIAVPPPAGSFALNHDGRLLVALKEELVLVDEAGKLSAPLARIEHSAPNLRLNDGVAMPDGSFVVGTMHVPRPEGQPPLGGLYRLRPDGVLHKLAEGFGLVNGPSLSPLDGRFYVCDSEARKIYTYAQTADGNLTDCQVVTDTAVLDSSPDGCCFDTEGGLWTALVHRGAIVRFAPDGTLSHRIDLPLTHPTALCFGGPALDDIYVTSIRDSGRLVANGPLDGAVLRVRGSGYTGLPNVVSRISV